MKKTTNIRELNAQYTKRPYTETYYYNLCEELKETGYELVYSKIGFFDKVSFTIGTGITSSGNSDTNSFVNPTMGLSGSVTIESHKKPKTVKIHVLHGSVYAHSLKNPNEKVKDIKNNDGEPITEIRDVIEALLDIATGGEVRKYYNSFWYRWGFRPLTEYRRKYYRGTELLHSNSIAKIGKWSLVSSSYKTMYINMKTYKDTRNVEKTFYTYLMDERPGLFSMLWGGISLLISCGIVILMV